MHIVVGHPTTVPPPPAVDRRLGRVGSTGSMGTRNAAAKLPLAYPPHPSPPPSTPLSSPPLPCVPSIRTTSACSEYPCRKAGNTQPPAHLQWVWSWGGVQGWHKRRQHVCVEVRTRTSQGHSEDVEDPKGEHRVTGVHPVSDSGGCNGRTTLDTLHYPPLLLPLPSNLFTRGKN